MAKAVSANKQGLIDYCPHDDEEESGWTSYFEDFSSNMNSSCFSLGGGGGPSSVVSDAASCASACKFSHHHNNHDLLSSSSSNNYGVPPSLPDMKLRFKKSRSKQISEDDPLEDTASSPLSSPKDGELNPTEMIPTKTTDPLYDDSMGKGFASENNTELKREGDHDEGEKNTNGKNKNDYADMKRREVPLFPLSMLVNHFG